jgi:pilus assembly protein CpaE
VTGLDRRHRRVRDTPGRADRGQAALETVGVLPLILLVLLLLWQFLLVGFTWMLTGNAADDAGRRLAVHDSDRGVRAAALGAVPDGWHRDADVAISRRDGSVTVTLSTPLLAPGLPSLPLSFSATSAPPAESSWTSP